MTIAASDTTTHEVILTEPDHRGASLAKALGARRVKRGGVRYFLDPRKGEQWRELYDGGFYALKRGTDWRFTRTLRPLDLYAALEAAREVTCSQ